MKNVVLTILFLFLATNAQGQFLGGSSLPLGTTANPPTVALGDVDPLARNAIPQSAIGQTVPAFNDSRIVAGGTAVQPGADLSAFPVTATGGIIARSEAKRAGDWINVADFGAVGNAVEATFSVTATAGAKSVQISYPNYSNPASNPAFTASNVGNLISINGAGASGAPLTTTIASVQSSGSITLAAPVSTTLSSAQVTVLWGSDDSNALYAAIGVENARQAIGLHSCVWLPQGNYMIGTSSAPVAFATGLPGCIVGAAETQSSIYLTPSFSGDVFAWADAWAATGQLANVPGPFGANFSIFGFLGASSQQNALMFYDRVDQVELRNIAVQNLPGRALYSGVLKTTSQAFMRESHLSDLRFFDDGLPGVPVVEFNSQGGAGTDGSNEIVGDTISIFGPAGPGLVVRNNSQGTIRDLNFPNLRIEGYANGTGGDDLLRIGDPTFTGAVRSLSFPGLELIDPYTNYAALHLVAPSTTAAPYYVVADGEIGGGVPNGKGIVIDEGRNNTFRFKGIHTFGTEVVLNTAASTNYVDIAGQEGVSSFSLATPANLGTPIWRYGDPTAKGANSGTVQIPGTVLSDALIAMTAPITAGSTLANQAVLQGSVAGFPISVTATGSDANIALQLLGKGNSGELAGSFARAITPTTADIPPGQCADWSNSADGSIKRYCNIGGTVSWTQQGSLILTYATAGTYSASIPTWAKTVTVDEVPGGASGANGTTAASGTATSGGAGGSGGLRRHFGPIPITSLTSPISVVVGAGGAQPTGSGANGNPGSASFITSGGVTFPAGNPAGFSSGGSTIASASGGPGGWFGSGGNASGATAGSTAYGASGASAGTPGYITFGPSAGGGGVVGGSGGNSGGSGDVVMGINGAGAGGGVSAAGVAQNGGGIPNQAGFGNGYFGIAPGGAPSVTYAVIFPGMIPSGGAGGAGGDATHPGANGALGSGPGAPGGGGGSAITGQQYGLGAAGNAGEVLLVFSP